MKPTAHNAETVTSPLVSDVSSKRLPGDIKYSVFSKAKDEKIDVDVTSGKMLRVVYVIISKITVNG